MLSRKGNKSQLSKLMVVEIKKKLSLIGLVFIKINL